MKTTTCTMCNGTGEIPMQMSKTELKALAAQELKSKGFSFGQIAEIMGYASKNSISVLLKKAEQMDN